MDKIGEAMMKVASWRKDRRDECRKTSKIIFQERFADEVIFQKRESIAYFLENGITVTIVCVCLLISIKEEKNV